MKNKKLVDNFIYICWGICVATLLLANTVLIHINEYIGITLKIIRYLCYLIFAVKIVYDWKNGSKITVEMLIISIISLLVAFFSKKNDMLILTIVLIAFSNKKIDKLININLYTYLTLFSIIVLLSAFRIIPDWTYARGEITRHSLGFTYPTVTIGMFLSIVMMCIYSRKDDMSYVEILALENTNIWIYIYTNGRLSFIIITLMLITVALYKRKWVKKTIKRISNIKILEKILYTLPTFFMLLTVLLSLTYNSNSNISKFIDKKIFNNRIHLSAKAFKEKEIRPFGSDIEWNGWGGYGYTENSNFEEEDYDYIDTSYIRIIFDYGIFATILIIYGYTRLLIYSKKEKDYYLMIITIFILIWSLIEPCIINMARNVFVLFFMQLLKNKEIKQLGYQNIKRIFIKEKKA